MADRPVDPIIESLREQLCERLDELGMTQADLSRKAGKPTSYINKLLKKPDYQPSISILRWLASLLECDLEVELRPKMTA